VGVAKTSLVLGKHSGRAALRHRLEQLGFCVMDREELQQTYYRFSSPRRPQEKHLRPGTSSGLLPDEIRERRHTPVAELD